MRWAGFIISVITAFAAPSQPSAVNSELAAAASRPPVEFALALVNASIPAGVEVRESDDLLPTVPVPVRQPERIDVGSLVQAFNRSHANYRAVVADGVVVIRGVAAQARFLDTPSLIHATTAVTGTMTAIRTILSPLDARLLQPVLGSILGDQALAGERAVITLDGRGKRVIDTLNQVALQSRSGWKIVTRDKPDARVVAYGSIYPGGAQSSSRMPR